MKVLDSGGDFEVGTIDIDFVFSCLRRCDKSAAMCWIKTIANG